MSSAHRCHQIVDWTTATTTHRTELWQQDHCGYVMGMYPSKSGFSITYHHLLWHRILPLNWRETPTTNIRVAYFHQPIYKALQGTMTEPNQLEVGMRACLKNGGISSRVYPFPIHQTVIDICWDYQFINFWTVLFIMVFCVKIIIVCDMWKWTQLAI